jgi:hypothetical protein
MLYFNLEGGVMSRKTGRSISNTNGILSKSGDELVIPFPNAVEHILEGKAMCVWIKDSAGNLVRKVRIEAERPMVRQRSPFLVVTTSRYNSKQTLFLADKSQVSGWWTTKLELAQQFGSMVEATDRVKRLRFGQPKVVASAEARVLAEINRSIESQV